MIYSKLSKLLGIFLIVCAAVTAHAQTPWRGVNGTVYAVAVDSAGKVYVGGNFTIAGNIYANNIAVWNPATQTWSKLPGPSSGQDGVDGAVSSIEVVGSKVYIGGKFGLAWRNDAKNVVTWDAVTGLWDNLEGGIYGTVSPDPSVVNSVTLWWDDTLRVGGAFTRAGSGTPVLNTATFNFSTRQWCAWGNPGIEVKRVKFPIDGRAYMSGTGGTYFNYSVCGGSWSATDLSPDVNNSIHGTVNDYLYGIYQGEDGYFVGGNFSLLNSSPAPAVNLAFLPLDSPPFGPIQVYTPIAGPSTDSGISAMAWAQNGFVVGGNLGFPIQVGLSSWTAHNLGLFNPSTATWSLLGTGDANGVNGPVNALATYSNLVYAAGSFTEAGAGICANNVAVWNSTYNSWSPLFPNTAPQVAITSPADGAVFSSPVSLNLTATAADDCKVVQVQFFQGTTLLGTDLSAPYSFAWNNVPSGDYVITAKALDNQGLETVSAPVTIRVLCPVTLANPSLSANQFGFWVTGAAGNWNVLASSDLQTWTAAGTVTLSGGSQTVTDSTISGVSQKFYKLSNGTCCSRTIGFTRISVGVGAYKSIARQFESADTNLDELFWPMADNTYLPDGTLFYVWNGTAFQNYEWVNSGTGWYPDGNLAFPAGMGVIVRNVSTNAIKVVFSGLVPEGTLTTPLPGGQNSFVGSKVPQAGGVESVLGYAPDPGDAVRLWTGSNFVIYTFDEFSLAWTPSEPVVSFGEAFLIQPANTRSWTRNFFISCP